MKVKEVTMYKFNELEEKSQKAAIVNYRENQIHQLNRDTADFLRDWMLEQLELKGYENMQVYFSLTYSQGDGVRFEGSLNRDAILNIAKRLLSDDSYHLLLNLTEAGYELWGNIEGTSNRYYHYNTMRVTVESDAEYEYDVENIEYLLESLENNITTEVQRISKELEAGGYEEIEHRRTDNYIKQVLKNEGCDFMRDGTIITYPYL